MKQDENGWTIVSLHTWAERGGVVIILCVPKKGMLLVQGKHCQ